LIGFEIAATVALLAGAGLVGRRVSDLLDVRPGFDTRDLRLASLRPIGPEYRGQAIGPFFDRVVERVRTRTGLEVTLIDPVPLDLRLGQSVSLRGDTDATHTARMRLMSPGALAFIGADMLRGRELTPDDEGAAVVSETLARRLWGESLPLGHVVRLTLRDETHMLRVVGITRDIRDGLYRAPGPEIYVSGAAFYASSVPRTSLVFRSPRSEAELTAAIRLAVMDVDPRQAISPVTSIAELTRTYTALSRFVGILLAAFAALATLLALTGILAVASGAVASRRREIGIRVAIGATPRHVLASLSRDVVPAIVLGAVAGLAAAGSLVQVLRWLVPGVAPFDSLAYGGAASVLVLIATAGAWFPARRALGIAPTLVMAADE
jgi:ABC-type antimicrobial peptide transport system permease subunit